MVRAGNRLLDGGVACCWRADQRRAVTMIEILVVVVIISILVGAVLTAGSVLMTRAQTTNTKAVLSIVNEALVEFEREQKAKPTLAKNKAYKKRYGFFPPDELEVFTNKGVPGDPNPRSRAPGGGVMVPTAPYQVMKFYTDPANPEQGAREHRDLAAMILAIELLGDSSKAILDRIEGKNRTAGVVDSNGDPAQFLDKDGNDQWSGEDHQIRYILDDWGNPLSYFAQRDWVAGDMDNTPSSNHADWNQWSMKMIRMNRGQPIIMSYGPDGDDQLTRDGMEGDAALASLVGDVAADNIVDNPFNTDNTFLGNELKEKLLQGVK